MITTDTYQSNTSIMRELLANFTALDQSVTSTMQESEIGENFKKLLTRVAVLCYYHGETVPFELVEMLKETGDDTYLSSIISYLETGKCLSKLNTDEQNIVMRRELQQEILHFSRIVDIASKTKEVDQESLFVNKRLRNSRDIPVFMKVMTEVMTVVRSRHLNRGMQLQVPTDQFHNYKYYKTNGNLSLLLDLQSTEFVLLINCERQRLRRELCFLYQNLLAYLTPLEAGLAICTYISEIAPEKNLQVLLLSVNNNILNVLDWSYNPSYAEQDLYESVKSAIPNIHELGSTLDKENLERMIQGIVGQELQMKQLGLTEFDIAFEEVYLGNTSLNIKLTSPLNSEPNFHTKIEQLLPELTQISNPVLSMESGHIHLDRDLDIDQEVGMEIGGYIYKSLKEVQTIPPKLMPMVDDDHVIVQLSPKEYDDFFRNHVDNEATYELIPESSPIIRSIVVALYNRIRNSSSSKNLKLGGNNLYLEIDEFTTCELFEDFNDRCDNGCAFFELGLLLYRSNPDVFSKYFNERFNMECDIHDKILSILSTDLPHNEKVAQIQDFYDMFSEVTNPHKPDLELCHMIDEFITSGITYTHLNVLEDYYEVQQNKVRSMIRFLDLPLHLVSVHFNARSGRLALNQ
ncbi:hypothetical protein P8864_07800 [Priestia flexa]|uniref:hypothetical protein n=1 Tax=Priestia flexa TaxID=86664 RepID=UPI000C244989|nr:hypothetical protein [Priestia flexa]MEC0665836.1 hypothetical protein [Priestia flexa]